MSGTHAPQAPERAPEQLPGQTAEPALPGGAPMARASDGGPPRPVQPGGPASPGPSRTEWLAAGLKLASALCALAAVGLVVRPLLLGELSLTPRMLTLQPTFSEEPVAPPPVAAETPAPQEAPPGSVTREERADFDGAVLMIDSEPSGATVLVDGRDQGETPVSVGLECLPGTPVIVSISLRGYERAKHTTLCPHDALVKVTAQLKKSPGKASGKK
ncbi:PEGA domain-containing protein [Archangium sp.]|uniref:PEGA domain-containing protein n=1 Tax=Archangium sp. TaxID=1872627 RepID=UPI00389A5278